MVEPYRLQRTKTNLYDTHVWEANFKDALAHHNRPYLSLNREDRLGATDDFATTFLHFSLFSTALWGLPNSRPVHSLMLSSYLFLCLPCLLPPSLCLARWFGPDLMNGRHDHSTRVCVSLRSSGGLRVVQLLAGSWHGLPRWSEALPHHNVINLVAVLSI